MPDQINRDLSNSLRNAVGGSQNPPPVPQPSAPVAPPVQGGSAAGSAQPFPGEDPSSYFKRTGQRMDPAVYSALIGAQQQQSHTPPSLHKAMTPQDPGILQKIIGALAPTQAFGQNAAEALTKDKNVR